MTEKQQIEYLAGQVHALVTFAGALIRTHPDPVVLRDDMDTLQRIALAITNSAMVSEDFLSGERDTHDSLLAFGPPLRL